MGVIRNLLRRPEVGLLALVHVIEGHQELVEHAVLPAVPLLELPESRLLVNGMPQNAVYRPCGQQGAVGSQVDTAREYRVDKASGISDEDHPRPPEVRIVVRVVLAYAQFAVLSIRNPASILEVILD